MEQDKLSQITYAKRKGKLEVTLRDEYFTPIYKSEANIADKKDMGRLMDDLVMKGLNFPKNWLRFNAYDKNKREDEEQN